MAVMAMQDQDDEDASATIVPLRADRFYTWSRVAFLLKWWSEIVFTGQLPKEAREEAGDVMGGRPLWKSKEEWMARVDDIERAWTYLDGVDADAAIWLWRYYVDRMTIDQIARRYGKHFYKVQGGLNQGIQTMVLFLNGET